MTGSSATHVSRADDQPLLIAHVIFRFGVGGLENGLVNLINSMPASRYRHVIICLTDYTEFCSRLKSADVQIIALHKRDGKDFGMYVRLWKAFRKLRPDFVHTRNLGTVDVVVPAVLAGVRYRVHGEHGWDMTDLHGNNRKYQLLRRFCGLFIHRHITVSKNLATWLREVVHIPARKITHIYNGVDVEKFSPVRATPAEGELDVPDAVVIGTVGRMAAVKNPLVLVQAFISLLARNSDRSVKLFLIMIGDGPLRKEVHQAVVAADIADLVWLPGERDDIADLLSRLDIFVMPSLNEGISNTILEAMATECPVVATDVGGNPELVTPGRTGFLVAAGDPEALADGIQKYLDHPALRVKHGIEGRRVVEDMFNLQSMVGQYLAVYDAVAGIGEPAKGE